MKPVIDGMLMIAAGGLLLILSETVNGTPVSKIDHLEESNISGKSLVKRADDRGEALDFQLDTQQQMQQNRYKFAPGQYDFIGRGQGGMGQFKSDDYYEDEEGDQGDDEGSSSWGNAGTYLAVIAGVSILAIIVVISLVAIRRHRRRSNPSQGGSGGGNGDDEDSVTEPAMNPDERAYISQRQTLSFHQARLQREMVVSDTQMDGRSNSGATNNFGAPGGELASESDGGGSSDFADQLRREGW